MSARPGASTMFDFGEWKSEVATSQEPGWHNLVSDDRTRHDRAGVLAAPDRSKH